MKWALLALCIGLAGYELIAILNGEKGDTISEVVWHLTSDAPLVPFIAGLICGHFFWGHK